MKLRTEDKFKSGIYVIQNKLNQKRYVGKAKNVYRRIKEHISALNTKSKDENPDYYLQAIKGCCQGTKNTYKGFRWHYVDLETNEIILKGNLQNNKILSIRSENSGSSITNLRTSKS